MPNQELLSYIEKQLSKNIPKEKIRQALIMAGWAMIDIEPAFLEIESKKKPNLINEPQLSESEKKLREMVKTDPNYYHFEKKPDTKALDSSPKKDVEKIFQHGVAQKPVESFFAPREKIEPITIKKTDSPKNGNVVGKIMLGIISMVLCVVGVYLYSYWQDTKDPLSLVPQNNDIAIVLNTDLGSSQIKQLEVLMARIPYFNDWKQKMISNFELMGYEEIIKTFTSALKTGKIKQIVFAYNAQTKKITMIIPGANDISGTLSDSFAKFLKDNYLALQSIEKENYKGFEISNAFMETYQDILADQKEKTLILSFSKIDGNFIISNDDEQLKSVIDNYKKLNLVSIFSKSSIKNIKNNPSFSKLKKYLPNDFLVYVYGNIDFNKIGSLVFERDFKKEEYLQNFLASIKQANATGNEAGFLSYVKSQEYGLESKQYFAGSNAIFSKNFSVNQMLANSLPATINNKNFVFYTESNSINELWKYINDNSSLPEKENMLIAVGMMKVFGLDVDQIIKNIDGQYAIGLIEPENGKNNFGFLLSAQSSNILEIEKGISFNALNSSQMVLKTQDITLRQKMSELNSSAEIYYSKKGFYPLSVVSDLEMNRIFKEITQENLDKKIEYKSNNYNFCAYAQLNAKDLYLCIDNLGARGVAPLEGICDLKTFKCNTDLMDFDDLNDSHYPMQNQSSWKEINGFQTREVFSKTFPSDDKSLYFAKKGDTIHLFLGDEGDFESILKNDSLRLSQTKEISENFNQSSVISSVGYFKIGKIMELIFNFYGESSDRFSEIAKSMIQIFPIVSNSSVYKDGIILSSSRFEIKDLGQSKIKEIELMIKEYLQERKNIYLNNDNNAFSTSSAPAIQEGAIDYSDSGDD